MQSYQGEGENYWFKTPPLVIWEEKMFSSLIFLSHPKPYSPLLPSLVSLPWLSNDQYLSLTFWILGARVPSETWLWLSALQSSLPGATYDG